MTETIKGVLAALGCALVLGVLIAAIALAMS